MNKFYEALSEVIAEFCVENGKDFVTVGEDKNAHPIPVDYLKQQEKNLPQNLKIEDLNVVEFSAKDINDFSGYGSVKTYYDNNIKGGSITHSDKRLGKIYFDDDGIGESIKINRPKNLYLVVKAKELVKQAKYDRPENLKHERRDGVVRFHILYTKAKIGEKKTRIVQIKIAEKANGKKYYFLRPVKTIKNSLNPAIAKDVNNDNSSLLANEATIIIYDFNINFKS